MQPPAAPFAGVSSGPPLQGLRVLLADDDFEMRFWMRAVLRPLGLLLTEVTHGDAIMDALTHDGPFALVITDVRMPGLSGLQVASRARAAGLAVPFLVITAFPDSQIRDSVQALPQTTLLDKPFRGADLRLAVHQLVGGAAEEPPRLDR